jgi:predicted TIM-barrel fold metal-dependent hydrolase
LSPDFDLSELGVGGADAMKRRYLQDEYLADASPWNLQSYVHVSCTSGAKAHLAEADWLSGLGGPLGAIVGTVDLKEDPAVVEADLANQAEHALFRGIRNMHVPDRRSSSFTRALGFLAERGMVYDLVVHPPDMAEAADALHDYPGLVSVVEHTGWPLAADRQHRALWRDGMRRLAGLGRSVHCKLTGIAIAIKRVDAGAIRPWIDDTIEIFGVDRCLAGSNFPVDGVFGTFDELINSLAEVIGAHGEDALRKIFADNAARVYGID